VQPWEVAVLHNQVLYSLFGIARQTILMVLLPTFMSSKYHSISSLVYSFPLCFPCATRSLNCLDRGASCLHQPFRCLLSVVSQNRVRSSPACGWWLGLVLSPVTWDLSPTCRALPLRSMMYIFQRHSSSPFFWRTYLLRYVSFFATL
jgi:hypothetical protein